jgi:hypothetical protein
MRAEASYAHAGPLGVRSSPGQRCARVCPACHLANVGRKQTLFKEAATCSTAIAIILHYLTSLRVLCPPDRLRTTTSNFNFQSILQSIDYTSI